MITGVRYFSIYKDLITIFFGKEINVILLFHGGTKLW
jgi:hypothetical protein